MIANDDIGYFALAREQQSDLPVYFS